MTHLLVSQLHFARSEFRRCLEGITSEEAVHRFEPMNCISWILGHLANQENWYWIRYGQRTSIYKALDELVGYGRPASTPPLDEMWRLWHEVTKTADKFLDPLIEVKMDAFLQWQGEPVRENIGTMLMRNIYHYWFHTGEAHAIRQMLGHKDLPQFVGNMSGYHFSIRKE